MRPKKEEYPEYYNYYINLISQEDVLNALIDTKKTTIDFISQVPIELANFAYANGKWTTKQVLMHCIDTERIISTRALRYSRGDSQKSTSFDENLYAANSHSDLRSLKDVEEEFGDKLDDLKEEASFIFILMRLLSFKNESFKSKLEKSKIEFKKNIDNNYLSLYKNTMMYYK